MEPVICIGQQPNGILPKRFFIAKLNTARKIKEELGGRIVWFLHDSDQDYRETRTRIPSNDHPEGYVDFNFGFRNKVQRKWTPLALKEFTEDSMESIRNGLLHLTNDRTVKAFDRAMKARRKETAVSEFCVNMYRNLGLLDGIEIVSSFSPEFRKKAEIYDFGNDYFYDTEYENEIVRAEVHDNTLRLHHGGSKYTKIREVDYEELLKHPEKISAGRDKRFDWMDSVIGCTHYIMGNSEAEYLNGVELKTSPELVLREQIEDSGFAWMPTE